MTVSPALRFSDPDCPQAPARCLLQRRPLLAGLALSPVARVAGLAGLLGGGCSTTTPASPTSTTPAPTPMSNDLRKAFAPLGRLRASINLGNPILAAATNPGEPNSPVRGVSVDLARALANELGVTLEMVVVPAALQSVQNVRGGAADIGFFAVDPARSEGIDFTAPYVIIEGAYLVRQASPLTANDQVDRAGTRVMVGHGSAYDLYLSRSLKAAQLMRTTTSQAVVERMLAEGAEVAAGVRQQLQADAQRLAGVRLLPGRFMVIEQAMGLQAGRGAAAHAFLRAFVERHKASGFVSQALQRHGIEGAAVAPPALASNPS
jgi:polar amino acid transport system substrate-binding protein